MSTVIVLLAGLTSIGAIFELCDAWFDCLALRRAELNGTRLIVARSGIWRAARYILLLVLVIVLAVGTDHLEQLWVQMVLLSVVALMMTAVVTDRALRHRVRKTARE